MKIYLKDLSQGSRIACLRRYRNITQEELGMKCGFRSGAGVRINQYERNHKHPRDDCLIKIAEILGVMPCYLKQYDFTEEEDMQCVRTWMKIADSPDKDSLISEISYN